MNEVAAGKIERLMRIGWVLSIQSDTNGYTCRLYIDRARPENSKQSLGYGRTINEAIENAVMKAP